MARDAIALLKDDHRTLRSLFKDFDELGAAAHKSAERLRERIVPLLSVHAAIEERILYPLVIEKVPDLEESILEGLEEHALAEQLLAQVASMDAEDRWFRPKMLVMADMVSHHIREEEREIFPALREELSRSELVELADRLEEERKIAPTVPPPSGQVRGLVENVTDRASSLLHNVTAPLRS